MKKKCTKETLLQNYVIKNIENHGQMVNKKYYLRKDYKTNEPWYFCMILFCLELKDEYCLKSWNMKYEWDLVKRL